MNKIANVKRSSFVSSAVSNLTLQKKRTMMQLGTDFTERCHVLFNRVVHERPVLMWNSYLLESQYFQKFRVPEHSSDLSGEVQPNQLKYRNSLYLCCLLPVWYWFQNQICVYSSGNTGRMSMKYLQNTLCFDEQVNANP